MDPPKGKERFLIVVQILDAYRFPICVYSQGSQHDEGLDRFGCTGSDKGRSESQGRSCGTSQEARTDQRRKGTNGRAEARETRAEEDQGGGQGGLRLRLQVSRAGFTI